MFAQDAPTTEKMAKEARWEGHVVRSNKDQIHPDRAQGGFVGRTDRYVRQLDPLGQSRARQQKGQRHYSSEVKDGDRVICTGTWDKDGVLHANLISKRLTGI